ncbi:HNH endonuclease [Microbacterium sp. YJN-G]|uniref:HNH endonuclease n=1 Tax=Microbacterium sp. YJN-G TaxID=2763257 RepID=UPI0029D40EF6|nr:HNH endonuclease [Microbacterium sp. YJN-G]
MDHRAGDHGTHPRPTILTSVGGSVEPGGIPSAAVRCRPRPTPSEGIDMTTLPLARHGTRNGYKKGCRCDQCREAENRRSRERYARHRAAGGYSDPGNVECTCLACGRAFKSSRSRSFCSRECYRNGVGTAPEHDWYISRGWRLFIYDRDGWRCQLCGGPVDMVAETTDPSAPTLDHIVPRSRGGSDDPDNLRLAHRGCNARRQSAIDEYLPGQKQEDPHPR